MTMTSDSERIFHVRNVPCSFPYCDVPTIFFSFLNKGFEPLFSFAKGAEEKKRLIKDFFFFYDTVFRDSNEQRLFPQGWSQTRDFGEQTQRLKPIAPPPNFIIER